MAKIMLVEDNPVNLFLYKETLENAGHDIIMSINGLDAVEIIKRQKPDVLIMDAVLPVTDGFQIYEKVKKSKDTPAGLCVFFISAGYSKSEMMKRTGLPIENIMTKPIDFQTLIISINKLCGTAKKTIEYATH
jgi:DNA-binding response OmpR family regulator